MKQMNGELLRYANFGKKIVDKIFVARDECLLKKLKIAVYHSMHLLTLLHIIWK